MNVNQKFGSLTAIKKLYSDKNHQAYWEFLCVCGNKHTARLSTVKYEHKRKNNKELPSCGCKELELKTIHGYRSINNTHPLYKVWHSIKDRCYNQNSPNYEYYGYKGVTLCDEWLNDPNSFIDWCMSNGYVKGLVLDKDILCDSLGIYPKIYSPKTCQFIDGKKNTSYSSNRKNSSNSKLNSEDIKWIIYKYINGDPIKDIAEVYEVDYSTIRRVLILEGYITGKVKGIQYKATK